MALRKGVQSTKRRCEHSNLAFGNSTFSFSDSEMSGRSPELADTCRFQHVLVQNNMEELPSFVSSHGNPNCAELYPQNISFLSYDPIAVQSSAAVLQNEKIGQIPKKARNRERNTTPPSDEIAARRKIANEREKERNRKLNEGINNLHKIIYLKEWEKPTVQTILKVAAMYIEFLREKIGQPDCFEEKISSEAQLSTALRKEFNEWRLRREAKICQNQTDPEF